MKAYIYILNTMADWEYGLLAAELKSKRYFLQAKKDLELITVSNDGKAKISMGGFKITPDISIHEIHLTADDILILPGADTWFDDSNQDILWKAKDYIMSDMNVAAICGATIGLAKHGALDSKFHTSNNKEYLQMLCPEYRGEKYFQDALVVSDKNLITASGVAPIEFCHEVLKCLQVFSEETLKNWFGLFDKKEAVYFHGLMNSLSKN